MFRVWIACLALLVLTGPAEATKVLPDRDWQGLLPNEDARKQAPKNGLITDSQAFEKLWKAWRKDEKVPQIDFTKSFVVVSVPSRFSKITLNAKLVNGNLRVRPSQTLLDGKGRRYSIAVFDREGVKTVNGKKLPGK